MINHSPAVVFEPVTVQVPTEGAATGPKEGAATGPKADKPAAATYQGPASPDSAVPPMRPVRGTALIAASADTIDHDQSQQLEAHEPVQPMPTVTTAEEAFSDDGELHPAQTATSKEPHSAK